MEIEDLKVEIENRLYFERTQPELRKYLAVLRQESYVIVKPGYTDTAAVAVTPIVEVDAAAAAPKQEKKSKKDKKAKETASAADPPKKGSP